MSVYTPTKYGPVPVITTPGTTTIDSQTQGTIAKLVKQPSTEAYPQVDSSGIWRYTENYKGPTYLLKDLPKTALRVGNTLTEAHTLAGDIFVDRFSAPALPSDLIWKIESVIVRQNQSGDTCDLRITYIGSGLQEEGGWTKEGRTTWSIQWQPYTVSPYAFCINEGKPDRLVTENPSQYDTADRYNIEQFLKQTKCDLSTYSYVADDGTQRKLNEAEQLITKKVISNVNCQWHYPIITRQSQKSIHIQDLSVEIETKYPEEIGGVDYTYRLSEISGCPYDFTDKNLQWVKVNDSVDVTKEGSQKEVFTRTESWMGVVSADANYYGNVTFSHNNLQNCRWKIGQL